MKGELFLWSYFKLEWKRTLFAKKNLLFILFLFLLVAAYTLIYLPNQTTHHLLDHEFIESDIQVNESLQEARIERQATAMDHINQISYYAFTDYLKNLQTQVLYAYEANDASRYLPLKFQYDIYRGHDFSQEHYTDMDDVRNEELYIMYTYLRYSHLIDFDEPITFSMIEEKTFLQVVYNAFTTYLPFFLFLTVIYFCSDMVTRDRNNQSLTQGMPLSMYKRLNIKTANAFLFTWSVILGLSLFSFIAISLQFGIGPLTLELPIFERKEVGNNVTYFEDSYETTLSLGEIYLKIIPLMFLLTYLFSRFTIMISLLVKREWLVITVSVLLLGSHFLLFVSVLPDSFVRFFPATYFQFGQVISGDLNAYFRFNDINIESGLLVIGISILIVEVLTFIFGKIIPIRSLYK